VTDLLHYAHKQRTEKDEVLLLITHASDVTLTRVGISCRRVHLLQVGVLLKRLNVG